MRSVCHAAENVRTSGGNAPAIRGNSFVYPQHAWFLVLLLLGVNGAAGLYLPGCRRPAPESDEPQAREKEPPKPSPEELLVFPEDLHVEDETVNDFVREAMTVCAAGDYDRFRLLWTAAEEPLSRGEFEQGWQAVQKVVIRALEGIYKPDPASPDSTEAILAYYGVHAEVHFDPSHPTVGDKPRRDVVLLAVQEHGEWRLSRAPRSLRTWLLEIAGRP